MSTWSNVSRLSNTHNSTTRHSSSRPRHGGTRLSVVFKSGILAKRGNILDLIDGRTIQSRTFFQINPEDEKILEIFNLDFSIATIFATICEDVLAELNIIAYCNNGLQIINTQTDMMQLIAEKYGVAKTSIIDELEGIDRNQLEMEEYKLKKLIADRRFFQNTVLMTYLDLTANRSFESLAQQIAVFHDRDTHRARLADEEAANRIARRDLAKQLRVQRIQIRSASYDVDGVIDSLRAQIEDSAVHAEAHSRYIEKWQNARAEQHEFTIQETEAKPLDSAKLYKGKLDGEYRAHSEITLLIKMGVNETMDKIEAMMAKYDADMENVDLQIQIQKNNYQIQQEIRRELEDKFKDHEKNIQQWLDFKQAREDARLYHLKMMQAAISVQAWWRGLMVRLQLGPYKPRRRVPFNLKK